MIAQFKVEQVTFRLGDKISRCVPWENTSVYLEIEVLDLLTYSERKSDEITKEWISHQASKATIIGRALSRQFEAKVRWNWMNSDQGHYVEKEEFRHQDGSDENPVFLPIGGATK